MHKIHKCNRLLGDYFSRRIVMKKFFCFLLVLFFPFFVFSQNSVSLDDALRDTAIFFMTGFSKGLHIAIIDCEEAETADLKNYITEELRAHFQRSENYIIIDRQNLKRIESDLQYQVGGYVSDESAQTIGRTLGAEVIISGRIGKVGDAYRLVMYASKVEKGTGFQRVSNVRVDSKLLSLLDTQYELKQRIMEPYEGKNNRITLTVTTTGSGDVYHDREFLSLRIYASRDCYLKITRVDKDNMVKVIYPFGEKDSAFIRGGQTRIISDNTRFLLEYPYGIEYILVAAYDKPFTFVPQAEAQISRAVISRGLKVVAADTRTEMDPVATAKCRYTIEPRL
jgi:TolB-like protein